MGEVNNKLKRITQKMGPGKAMKSVFKRAIQEMGLETANELNAVTSDFSCPIPSHYTIDTCNVCNLKCPFCFTGLGTGTAPKGIMSLDNFKIILDKIAPYAKCIDLYSWGEPFLNPNIIEMVSLASEKGIETSIHSNLNAKRFDEKECIKIIQSGLSFLHGSIDGASQETYGLYKRGGSFDKAIDNLVQLKAVKEKMGSKTPRLHWGFLINKFNEHEIEKAKQIASDLGIEISFSLMSVLDANWVSSYHKNINKLVQLKKEERKEEERIEEKKRKKKMIIVNMTFKILRRINNVIHKINSSKFPKIINNINLHKDFGFWCKQPFNMITVSWDGNVFPCCAVHDDKMILGNLLTTDIYDLWNN